MKYEDGAFVRLKYSGGGVEQTVSLLLPPHVPWTGLGVDTVLHAERPAPNRLSHVETSEVKRNYSKMPAKGGK
jgi:hypothetical protein